MSFELFRNIAAGAFGLNLLLSIVEVTRGHQWSVLALPMGHPAARWIWIGLVVLFLVVALASPLLGQGLALLDWLVAGFILIVSALSVAYRLARLGTRA